MENITKATPYIATLNSFRKNSFIQNNIVQPLLKSVGLDNNTSKPATTDLFNVKNKEDLIVYTTNTRNNFYIFFFSFFYVIMFVTYFLFYSFIRKIQIYNSLPNTLEKIEAFKKLSKELNSLRTTISIISFFIALRSVSLFRFQTYINYYVITIILLHNLILSLVNLFVLFPWCDAIQANVEKIEITILKITVFNQQNEFSSAYKIDTKPLFQLFLWISFISIFIITSLLRKPLHSILLCSPIKNKSILRMINQFLSILNLLCIVWIFKDILNIDWYTLMYTAMAMFLPIVYTFFRSRPAQKLEK